MPQTSNHPTKAQRQQLEYAKEASALIRADQAQAGRWYYSEQYGKILCCGTADPQEWRLSFVILMPDKHMELRFLAEYAPLTESPEQSW